MFIQAAGLAYHRRAKRGVYHQGRRTALASHHASACISLRLDDIPQQVADDIHAFGVIWRGTVEMFTNLWYNNKNRFIRRKNMTYKNGLKEYALTGVMFGVPMGILFGLMHLSLLLGVITGFLCGFLFAFLIFLFVKYQEKKFDKKRTEIAKERKIICDGGATINGNGGWMFFTENGIEFYPHKINISTKEIVIPTNTIESVKTNKNQILVSANGKTIAIVVSHNKEWKKQIEDALTLS